MAITAEDIRNDIVANLGNRDDLSDARIYRAIHYAQLTLARVTRWRDLRVNDTFAHSEWAGSSLVDDGKIDLTSKLTYSPIDIRTLHSFYIADFGQDEQGRLRRIATEFEWDNLRDLRVGSSATRDAPTNYFFATRSEVQLYPVPDIGYTYGIRYTRFPTQVTETIKAQELSVRHVEDLVTAKATQIIARGIKQLELAQEYAREYSSMLELTFRNEKDGGDFDMAAFRQELDYRNHSNWWSDPFSTNPPSGLGDQV